MPRCAFCGADVEVLGRVGRREECPSCKRDLHACLQCKLFDRSYHNQCREPQAACVSEKESSNFCEFFDFGRDAESERARAEDSRKKLEELFRKTS